MQSQQDAESQAREVVEKDTDEMASENDGNVTTMKFVVVLGV